ncbi:MAG: hypothetical protein L3J49_12710 [Desulfobulbaceae bacterium]|nr:hypothetical protein [Desulfobulbaceae bacterium]
MNPAVQCLKTMVFGKPAIILTLFGLLLLPVANGYGGTVSDSSIVLTTTPAAPEPSTEFAATGRVYALVTLSGLDPGQYTAAINWVDPAGNINQYTTLSFTLKNQSSYTFHSWLRLMKNGPLKRTFTGKDFDDEYLGQWQIHIFINDVMLEKKNFTLY